MQEEPANKFIRRERHDFLPVSVSIIPPLEGNASVMLTEDTIVGDSDAMGIAAKVIHHLLRTAEGRFAVGNPIGFIERCNKRVKLIRIAKVCNITGKLQLLQTQIVKELAPEFLRENLYGDEEFVT